MAYDFAKAPDAPSGPSEVARLTVSGGDNPPPVVIQDAKFLLSAKYQKAGGDLILTGADGQKVVIEGYFNHDNPPDLMAAGGGTISAALVERLAVPNNPGQYAQIGVPAGAAAIGRVERVGGTAVVQHANGVVEELQVGDPVLQGDVVETRDGSQLGISFNDGTAFNLGTNARMVLNELVYSSSSSSNSGVFSLVKGSIAFVAGQVAKSGEMKIVTPISTMGIRGTTVNTTITTDAFGNTISVVISLMSDPDNGIGRVSIIDPVSNTILATMNSTDTFAVVTQTANLSILAQLTQKTPEMIQQELAVAQVLFPIFLSNPVNFTNLPQPQDLQPRAASIGTPGTVTDTRTITESISVTITQPSDPNNPNSPPAVLTLPTQQIPVVIPDNLAPLITVDTPPHLIEATTADPGVPSSTALITKSDLDGLASYDFGALAAAGWVNNGNGTFSKVGTYGTATLNAAANTLIYVLDNTKADPLNTGDVVFDLFTIPVIDNSGASASATATFTIEGTTDAPANTAPVAVENIYGVVLGQTLHVLANGVLGNDMDAEHNPLTAQLVSGSIDGVMTFNSDGSFDFRPFFNGTTTFSYKANDGSLDSNTATVTIQVSLDATTRDFSANTSGVAVFLNDAPGQSFILAPGFGNHVPIPDGNNVIGTAQIDFIAGNNHGGVLNGGGGNDAIVGGSGNDILIGGTGSDRLTGGLGDDFFIFRPGFGAKDLVTDFNVGDALHHDTLDLRGLGFASIADVLNHTDTGPNAVIHVGVDQIELTGITKAMLEVHALNVMMI